MLKILINNQKVEIYDFDNTDTILKRYTIVIVGSTSKDNLDYLYPSYKYFRFEDDYAKFENNIDYKVFDIRDDIKQYEKLSKLLLNEEILRLKAKYRHITKLDIICLWFITHKFEITLKETHEVKNWSELSEKDFILYFETQNMKIELSEQSKMRSFISAISTYDTVEKYIVTSKNNWILNNTIITKQGKIYSELSKYESYEHLPFIQEEVTEDIFLSLPNGETIYEIFNAISVSDIIPFVCLYDGKKIISKVHSNFLPPDEWIMFEIPSGTKYLNIYILSKDLGKKKKDDYLKKYSQCILQTGHSTNASARIIYKIGENSSKIIRKRLFDSMKNRVQYELIDSLQFSVKGKFTLPKAEFNRALFLDFVCNNDMGSYFFFVDESDKSNLNKPKFSLYYEPNQTGEFYNTLTITMTQILSENEDPKIEVRVSRAQNLYQVDSFILIFCKLFSLYLKVKNNIISEYTDLYKKLDFKLYTKKKAEKKENLKTGKRLAKLQLHDPITFGKKYSKACQQSYQPYLIDNPDKFKKKVSKIPEIGEELEKFGVMEWPNKSNSFYACYPREKNDAFQNHIFPGLVDKAGSLVPCCFVTEQYSKEKGGLAKYRKKGGNNVEINEDEGTDTFSFDRPLGNRKMAPRGRFAELPYYIQLLASSVGYEKIELKRKVFSPLLRYGVAKGPDSFVHCLERATNKNYDSMNLEEKKIKVKEVLAELSEESDEYLVVCKQEMYDYTYDEIRDHLRDEDAYINPNMYINIFCKYYDCNIVIFEVNENNPDGKVSIPRYSIVHLSYKFTNKNTAVIVKMKNEDDNYQCEIIGKYVSSGKFDFLFDGKEPFVDAIIQANSLSNIVYITSTNGKYVTYEPTISI